MSFTLSEWSVTVSPRIVPPVIAYAAAIIGANLLTSMFGLVPLGVGGLAVTAGTFAAGAALIARDWVHAVGGRALALCTVLLGALLSWAVASPALAVASGVAFAVSELVDLSVYSPLRTRSVPLAVVASSVVAAPVDTVLFLWLAGFGVTWQAVLGQFLVKTAMALLAAGVLGAVSVRK